MKTFIDAEGREWEIEINIATARRIRERCATIDSLRKIDFLDYAAVLASLADVFFVADLLYVVCEPQAVERGIEAEAFGRALKGKILFDAASTLTAEYIDFFPDPTTTEKMRKVVEKLNAANAKIAETFASTVSNAINSCLADAETRFGAASSSASRLLEADSTPIAS